MSSQPVDATHRMPAAFVALTVREREQIVDLPRPLSALIGRETTIAAVVVRLQSPTVRLLTLTGPGGVGKTRLSLEAARRVTESFEEIHFIPLASTRDLLLAPAIIARRLGVQEATATSLEQGILDYIGERAVLLLLDNVEQLPDIASLVVQLLSRASQLKIMVTSRVLLRVSGEHEFHVPSLGLPDPETLPPLEQLEQFEAIALLLDRIRTFQPGFVLDTGNAVAVVEICRRLDGLPLAIELAAARIKVMTPQSLRSRLSNRLELLTGGPRDLPLHQQTMRDTIAWSYDLLDPEQQALFARLSLFAGGIAPEAAETVCADAAIEPTVTGGARDFRVLERLGDLADKSLLRSTTGAAGEPRFTMLATIREFGLERLDAGSTEATARSRYAGYFLALAETAAKNLTGPDQGAWFDRLDEELSNLRVALAWLAEQPDALLFVRMANALQRFWRVRGMFGEGRGWLEQATSRARSQPALLASVLCGAGELALTQGDSVAARPLGEESLATARVEGDRPIIARALALLGSVAYRATDYARAGELFEEARSIFIALDDDDGAALSLFRLGQIAMDTGDFARAQELFKDARDGYERSGNQHGAAASIDNLGVALYCLDRIEEAETLTHEALTLLRRFGDTRGIAVALGHAGKCASRQSEYERAWSFHLDALQYRRRVGDRRGFAVWLEAVASLLAASGDADTAAVALGAADALREAASAAQYGNELVEHHRIVALLHGQIGEQAFDAAWYRGRELSLDDAIERVAAIAAGITNSPPESGPAQSSEESTPFGLSAREVEVLRLMIARQRDREIADALYISPRTVARHVASIFNKLGVHSRHEAAALAAPFFE